MKKSSAGQAGIALSGGHPTARPSPSTGSTTGRFRVFPIFNTEGQHGSLELTRYPKPGDPNPAVRIGTVHTGTTGVTWAAFSEKDDQYFGHPFWTPDSRQLLIQWMNRAQDTLILYGLDPRTGIRRTLCTEHQQSWVDLVRIDHVCRKKERDSSS